MRDRTPAVVYSGPRARFWKHHKTVASPRWPAEYRPREHVQRPGELVYVPAGWPYAVLNLDWTYAVAHNYAILDDECLRATRLAAPDFFLRLAPHLATSKALPRHLLKIAAFLDQKRAASLAPVAKAWAQLLAR